MGIRGSLKCAFVSGLLLFPVFAHAGKEIGNGGGLAEKNILFAKANLQKFVDLCLSSKTACGLTSPGEENVLRFISQNLAEGKEGADLVFDSEFAHPGTFLLNGQVKVAKTDTAVGSSISINTDLIYTKDQGHYVAMDVPMAASVLVHELGHHDRTTNCDFLDRVATRIQLLLQKRFHTIGFNPIGSTSNPDDILGAVSISFGSISELDQLFVFDTSGLTNLTSLLVSHIPCDPNYSGDPYKGAWIKNIHWAAGLKYDQKRKLLQIPLEFWMTTVCDGPAHASYNGELVDLGLHAQVTANLAFTWDVEGQFDKATFRPELTQVCYADIAYGPKQSK